MFVNPRVASLPQHHHLFGGDGCFNEVVDNRDGGKLRRSFKIIMMSFNLGSPCVGADILPAKYESILKCFRTTKDLEDSSKKYILYPLLYV